MYLSNLPYQSTEQSATEEKIKEISKTQRMRLLDVFFIGPSMILGGLAENKPYWRAGWFLMGVGTVIYNGHNYLQQRKELERLKNASDQQPER